MRSCQGRLLWILLAIAGGLLTVAAVVVGVYLIFNQQQSLTVSHQDPIAAILPEEIAPDLALYPLAGVLELETIDAAITRGDLETAYAAVVLGLGMSDAQRIGRLVFLGAEYTAREVPERASLAYQQISDMAILSPRLNDPARADALLAAGRGWASLGQDELAAQAYDQVYLIAVQSPFLQMAHRRDLLIALEGVYETLGQEERAEQCREGVEELQDQTAPHPAVDLGSVPGLPEREFIVSSPHIGELEEARRQTAYGVLEALSDGAEAPPELLAALAEALQAEDAAKTELYHQELEATTQSGKRIGIQWQLVDWLTLKYKVAVGGYGLSLVPAWEAGLAEIQSSLSKAYEGLFFDYEDLVTALPDAATIGPGSYMVRRQFVLDGRLGRYPNYPAEQMASKLQDSVQSLISAGMDSQLFVDVGSEDGELRFFLSPVDEYGASSQSP